MAKVTLMPGPCGLVSVIEAQKTDRRTVSVKLPTQCGNYKPLEEELTEFNAFDEVLGKLGPGAKYTSFASKYSKHAACPLPCAIIKAVEVASGMALPKDVTIKIEK
jgi:hypothetical protein